jgi:hypothetical protein
VGVEKVRDRNVLLAENWISSTRFGNRAAVESAERRIWPGSTQTVEAAFRLHVTMR